MNEITTKTIVMPKPKELTTEGIEKFLNCDIIRWAITEVQDNNIKIVVTYKQ